MYMYMRCIRVYICSMNIYIYIVYEVHMYIYDIIYTQTYLWWVDSSGRGRAYLYIYVYKSVYKVKYDVYTTVI